MTVIHNHYYGTEPVEKAEPGKWDGESIAGAVVKSSEAQRYTLTVAYPANTPDAGVARDGFQDFATPAELEKAAWDYMRKSRKIGLRHEDGTEGAGEPVESYITRSDQVFKAADGTEQIVPEGSWMLGVIWNEETWQVIKEGGIGGVSMQGKTTRRRATPADMAHLRKRS